MMSLIKQLYKKVLFKIKNSIQNKLVSFEKRHLCKAIYFIKNIVSLEINLRRLDRKLKS